jgi:hypothetical protein
VKEEVDETGGLNIAANEERNRKIAAHLNRRKHNKWKYSVKFQNKRINNKEIEQNRIKYSKDQALSKQKKLT